LFLGLGRGRNKFVVESQIHDPAHRGNAVSSDGLPRCGSLVGHLHIAEATPHTQHNLGESSAWMVAKNLFHFSPKSVLASHLIPPFDWRYIPVETKADHRHVGLKKHHNAT